MCVVAAQIPPIPFEEKLHAIAYINSNCGAQSGRSAIMRQLIALGDKAKVRMGCWEGLPAVSDRLPCMAGCLWRCLWCGAHKHTRFLPALGRCTLLLFKLAELLSLRNAIHTKTLHPSRACTLTLLVRHMCRHGPVPPCRCRCTPWAGVTTTRPGRLAGPTRSRSCGGTSSAWPWRTASGRTT